MPGFTPMYEACSPFHGRKGGHVTHVQLERASASRPELVSEFGAFNLYVVLLVP